MYIQYVTENKVENYLEIYIFQVICLSSTYVTENKDDNFLEVYIFQV